MKNCCVYNDAHKREKKSQHKFLKRAGFFDHHHIKSSHKGGESIPSNLLRMDAYRHDAWHLFFKYKTLDEVIIFFSGIPFKNRQSIISSFSDKVGVDVYMNNAWFLLFGDQSIEKIIKLLIRVQRFKRYQSFKLITHGAA